MSNDATPRLTLPYIAAGQAQKHLTLNEALSLLDGLAQIGAVSRTVAAQPTDPDDGALYILPAAATGAAWTGEPAGALMRHQDGAWVRLTPGAGALAWVIDEQRLLVMHGGAWIDAPLGDGVLQNLTRLGVGTTADATNPLSVRLNKALFAAKAAAEGGDGDLRLTLTKEAAADVLSLLFQSGFSGRAELGLIGDDNLTLKVSADGASWATALNVRRQDGATGVGGAAVAGRPLTVHPADNGQVNANLFADVGANYSGMACFGGNLYPRASDNSLRLRYTHASFGGAALVLHRQAFNEAEIVFAGAGAADSLSAISPAAKWTAADRATRLFGPLYLADYATGALPAASSCPGGIVNDTTLNRAVRSDGTSWTAL